MTTLYASSQAAAEYAALSSRNVLQRLSGIAQEFGRFADRNPLVVAGAVALLILVVWATRTRTH